MKTIATGILGLIATCLGLLWLLQGTDLIPLKPILCFANCETITGGSWTWGVAGAIVLGIGMILIVRAFRKLTL